MAKFYYAIITVYPFNGASYPKVFFLDEHPLSFYRNEWTNYLRTLPKSKRPYRSILSFYEEITEDLIEEFKPITWTHGKTEDILMSLEDIS